MTFEQFKKSMFRDNRYERIMWGIPVIQYEEYCKENEEYLEKEFYDTHNQEDKEDE